MTERDSKPKHRRFKPLYLILIVPVVAALWTSFYNSAEPAIAGIPFFYWYQLLWVPLSAVILFFVYRAERHRDGE